MKYKVKYNDDGVKIDAILRIKDDSFVVTYIDYLVNVHYEDIENITYNNNTLKISENGNEHVIYCSEEVYNAIKSRCDYNDIDFEESMQAETVLESEKENIEKLKKYKALVLLPDGQSECNLSFTTKDLVIDDGIDTLRIPISAIIRVILEDNNNIKVLSNGNKNIIIKSDKYKEIHSELKKLKVKIPHNNSSSITVKDAFGNDLMQIENTKRKSSSLKILFIMIAIIGAISLFISRINRDNPASTIAWDIKQNQSILGYGTRYDVGEVESAVCEEQDSDGNGRYIIRCNIVYYPKRRNGTTAMDSKMNETIYAVYMRNSKDNFSRYYTSFISDSFKQNSCWGMDKAEGITCSY